jgi:hypothetical protein
MASINNKPLVPDGRQSEAQGVVTERREPFINEESTRSRDDRQRLKRVVVACAVRGIIPITMAELILRLGGLTHD